MQQDHRTLTVKPVSVIESIGKKHEPCSISLKCVLLREKYPTWQNASNATSYSSYSKFYHALVSEENFMQLLFFQFSLVFSFFLLSIKIIALTFTLKSASLLKTFSIFQPFHTDVGRFASKLSSWEFTSALCLSASYFWIFFLGSCLY